MHTHENNTPTTGIPSWPDTFRLYLQFLEAKRVAADYGLDEYSTGALNVVMDYIADHIDEPAIRGLAAALGEWEVS